MGWKMKNFNILGVHGKIRAFGGGSWKANKKRAGFGQFADLRGVSAKKRGVDTPMHTMNE